MFGLLRGRNMTSLSQREVGTGESTKEKSLYGKRKYRWAKRGDEKRGQTGKMRRDKYALPLAL